MKFEQAFSAGAEQDVRFRVYQNYLESLSGLLKGLHPDPSSIVREMVVSASFSRIQGGKCRDLDLVRRNLTKGWMTEVRLAIDAEQDDLVSYSNHWAPIQLYYTVYGGIRAWFDAAGMAIPQQHTSTLRTIASEIDRHPDSFPQPWRILCVDDPEDRRFTGLPGDVTINPVSSLQSGQTVDPWDSFGMFLRTTRERRLQGQLAKWKHENKRKRTPANVRSEHVERMWPTSLFDVLHRLRMRSNYDDADSFLLSLDNEFDAVRFHRALREIGWHTLLVVETLIARYIGKRRYLDLVEGFESRETRGYCKKLVCARRDLTVAELWTPKSTTAAVVARTGEGGRG